MTKVNTRRFVIVLAIAVLAGAFFVGKLFQSAAEPPRRSLAEKPIPSIETMSAQNGTVTSNLEIQGQLVAFDKIDLFSEVSGTLLPTTKPFKIGTYFAKGSSLIQVDDTEAKLSLLAQKSTLLNAITQLMPDLKIDYPQSFDQWKSYLDNFEVDAPIQAFPKPLNDQERYFIASRNLLSQFYNIKSAEERLGKYSQQAPFSGVITQTSINPGALVRVGQKLGELMNTNNYELEVTIPLSDLKYLQTGSKVKLHSNDIEGSWTGTIKRINDQVDPGTQSVKIFINVRGKALREGMYLEGEVAANNIENAMSLPRNLLINQNAVYAVKDAQLQLLPVEVLKITKEDAIVSGLPDGTMLLKAKLPGAYDGMKVQVLSNSVGENPENLNGTVGSIR